MRVLKGQDLMQGSDHEFIVQLYRRILLRGPDEGGYRHYRDRIEADPTCRRRLIAARVKKYISFGMIPKRLRRRAQRRRA
jgi:hypothetical protein